MWVEPRWFLDALDEEQRRSECAGSGRRTGDQYQRYVLRFHPKDIKLSANENVTIVFMTSDAEHDGTVEGAPGIGHIVHGRQGKTPRVG